MSSTPLHFIASTFTALSHARPMLGVVSTLLKDNPNLTFTIFAHKTFVGFVNDELARSPNLAPDVLAQRVRVIGVSQNEPKPSLEALKEIFIDLTTYVPEGYKTILANGVVTCTTTGKRYDFKDVPRPTLFICDMFSPLVGQKIKEISPEIKLIHSFPPTVGSFIRHYGPPELGGLGNWEAETKAAMENGAGASGKSFEEVADSLHTEHPGELQPNREGVQLYDYEMHPQDVPQPPIIPILMASTMQAVEWADGSIMPSIDAFEPKSTEALQRWYTDELHKRFFLVGPQLSVSPTSPAPPPPLPADHPFTKIFTFLSSQHPKSVVLISFGTVFYPFTHPNQVEVLLRTLLETKTPFIFSRASMGYAAAPLSKELEAAIAASPETAIIADFVPQQEVLAHPSLGAMLTHGGAGSTFEIIMYGVVGIFWPFAADQPVHAAYLTENLDAAFELVQIRTGPGARPPRRGGQVVGTDEVIAAEIRQVVADLKGEVGQRKRKNIEAVQKKFLEAKAPGGSADLALKALVEFGTPKE
ncbi:hypothetical protein FS837_007066 [Tulasnella sp. UAMH 9824]|nr:hypothetical protein FS837_007066 [Tulasnella sp. UAMH 9824]